MRLWARVLLACCVALVGAWAVAPGIALADESSGYSASQPPALSSRRALLIDEQTGTVLYEQGADERCYPASITKVMTALLVLENVEDLDAMVTVEESDLTEVTWDSSSADITAGDTLSVRDLLAGLLIPSGNDASYVLARYVAGDWQSFVTMMNERAAELGCSDTHFVNPCGLHDDNHYTTARDLVIIFRAALQHPEFAEIASNATWDIPATSASDAHTLETTDELINPESPVYMGDDVVASKTGSTWEAGRCLITLAQRDGRTLLGVTLGAPMEEDADGVAPSFYDMRALLEWGFNAWTTGEVVSVGDLVGTAEVELSSDGDEVGAMATSAVVATVPSETTLESLTIDIAWSGSFQAPLAEGDALGEATVSLGDRVLGTVSVGAASAMALSIPSFVMWWLSDPLHVTMVVVIAVVAFVLIGLIAGASSRARRRARRRSVAAGRRIAPVQTSRRSAPHAQARRRDGGYSAGKHARRN